MNAKRLIAAATDSTRGQWLGILRSELGGEPIVDVQAIELVTQVVSVLERSSSQREGDREQRLSDLLGILRFTRTGMIGLATISQSFPSYQKNAVLRYLPIEIRPLIYGKGLNQETPASDAIRESHPTEAVAPENISGSASSKRSGFVLILSKSDDQEANKALLESAGFGSMTVGSLDSLEVLITDQDLCAYIVDSSYLIETTKEEQVKLFHLIASHSSFVWIRVTREYLRLDELQLNQLVRNARCQASNCESLVSVQQDDRMREAEVAHIKQVASIIQAGDTLALTPAELIPIEARLLAASVALEFNYYGSTLMTPNLHVKFFPGGRTSARTIHVTLPDSSFPLVAKIDDPQYIAEEAKRFHAFIRPWNPDLNPTTHFHAGIGIMLFRLVSEIRSQFPAPSLEDRLSALWIIDRYGPREDCPGPTENDLVQAIAHAAAKLSQMNKQRPTSDVHVPCFNRPYVNAVKRMWENGVRWGLNANAFTTLELAESRFEQLNERSILHGDIHLRNILVRGDRESYLIDYAQSGPGHPGVDLVRLELSLFFCAFQQMDSEDKCRNLQHALSFRNLSAEELLADFPEFAMVGVNRVCLHGMLEAKARALDVIEHFGGGLEDYIAVKTLVAWYSLIVPNTQLGLVRSVIEGLSDMPAPTG